MNVDTKGQPHLVVCDYLGKPKYDLGIGTIQDPTETTKKAFWNERNVFAVTITNGYITAYRNATYYLYYAKRFMGLLMPDDPYAKYNYMAFKTKGEGNDHIPMDNIVLEYLLFVDWLDEFEHTYIPVYEITNGKVKLLGDYSTKDIIFPSRIAMQNILTNLDKASTDTTNMLQP